ncbi:MAG: ATP-dependent zinc metalloprotease FtsH [Chloroflexi bacterium]|jgi:cell division protease FtsH|nr:ATP-dependent zinc metalloprotease FtsH [Chloroflexota bacterium]MBT4142272.1 ATP-dependent zinc metalloprotease FtsH [Chloroflexota bacterium]MBT5252917.1 ATP-dependent zinc metalloprotease FtsH [Chloroflexota bacterium]MBT5892480.1 ATP-dependent zinc metalloprotease FtsH [Chloroflexota bacterium]MBT7079034.1 ATP-dependent zinc metalloprotease FtsH [Chloroflexota bacterium]
MSNRWMRNSLVYLVIIVAVITIFLMFVDQPTGGSQEIGINEVVELAKSSSGSAPLDIEVQADSITITDGLNTFTSVKEDGSSLAQLLLDAEVPSSNYSLKVSSGGGLGSIFGLLIGFLPLILFGGILLFMMRQAQGSNNQQMGFGKSKAKMFIGTKATVTFFDVAGVPEAKEELEEVVEFLKYPERFQALGAKIPAGVLLVGPPGTGKTLLARAVAGEAGVPFFSISGSEFVEMFVGVGASRVRDLFEQARRHAPCIIFVDEIDAVGRHRGAGVGGGHDEREQTLNQMLVEMDGFDAATNVIVIAATNRPDILDPALLRPGRFDRRVMLDNPDIRGRTAILDVHAKGKPFEKGIDLANIAKQTPGFSGADLANLINEGALLAARGNQKLINYENLTEAIDRVSMGPARKSKVISEKDRNITAYHEAGHALVAHLMPGGSPIGKISIIARGQAGGFTRWQQEDKSYASQEQLEAQIASAMGGRAAEVLKVGDVTTGASNDFEQATNIAREMVMRLGMSEKLSKRSFGKRQGGAVFLGREMSEERDYSLKTESIIDDEINRLLHEGEERANTLLKDHDKELEGIAKFLLEHETIDSDQFVAIIEGKDPLLTSPPATDDPSQPSEPTAPNDQVDDRLGEATDPEPQAT